jgi:hypothetical protein
VGLAVLLAATFGCSSGSTNGAAVTTSSARATTTSTSVGVPTCTPAQAEQMVTLLRGELSALELDPAMVVSVDCATANVLRVATTLERTGSNGKHGLGICANAATFLTDVGLLATTKVEVRAPDGGELATTDQDGACQDRTP